MKADCKKCKHCMQIHGREVMCRRFWQTELKLMVLYVCLEQSLARLIAFISRKEQEVQWLEFTINRIVGFVHICV